MFVFLAVTLPLACLTIMVALVAARLRRLRLAHEREMRVRARELGELERLGPAAGLIMFGLEPERDPADG